MKHQTPTELCVDGKSMGMSYLDPIKAVPTLLSPDDELLFPLHKRVFTQFSTDLSGMRELHLYYGDKEISFDERRVAR
jgi:hypothetical protein